MKKYQNLNFQKIKTFSDYIYHKYKIYFQYIIIYTLYINSKYFESLEYLLLGIFDL